MLSLDGVARDIDSPRISYVRLQVRQDCLTQPQRVSFQRVHLSRHRFSQLCNRRLRRSICDEQFLSSQNMGIRDIDSDGRMEGARIRARFR
jgi:hypothetical protein